MMWNWVVSTLAIGAAVVLYDGSPLKPTPTVLWDLVDRLGWVPALACLARLSAEPSGEGQSPASHQLPRGAGQLSPRTGVPDRQAVDQDRCVAC